MKGIKEITIILLITVFTLLGFGAGFQTGIKFSVDTSIEMLNALDIQVDNIKVDLNETLIVDTVREIYEEENLDKEIENSYLRKKNNQTYLIPNKNGEGSIWVNEEEYIKYLDMPREDFEVLRAIE